MQAPRVKVDVFISYSTPNRAVADAIRTAFEDAGVSCWMATEAIREGGDWAAQIAPAIAGCKVLLLVLSAAASSSTQVAREVHIAMQQRKRIIPYRVDGAEPSGTLEYFLAGIHRVDAPPDRPLSRIGDLLERTRRALAEMDQAAVAPGAQSDSPHNLPPETRALIGREGDLAELGDELRTHRLVSLVGPGGVGKTSIAIEAARRALGLFPQGVWYAGLAPISDAALATSAIEAMLPDDRAASALLLVDNCEHVLDAAAQAIRTALESYPRLHVLVTSVQRLGVPGEYVYQLAPLGLPHGAVGAPSIDELNASPAARLLIERASAAGPINLELETERAAVASICRNLDGLPLALELAGARASTLSFEQILKGIDQRFRLLTKGAGDELPHHRTLSALIDWSFRLLGPEEQSIFLRLGAFPGRFTLDDVAKSVCADVEEFDLLDAIDSLAKRSLLAVDSAGGRQRRYYLLESLRAYLRERLNAGGELAMLAPKVAERGAELAALANDDENGVDVLNANFDNVRFALGWYGSEGHDAVAAAKITVELSDLWIESGRWPEGRYWSDLLIAKRESLPADLFESLLLTAGHICSYCEDHEAQIGFYQTALGLATSAGDRKTEARIKNGLATARFHLGSFDEAQTLWEQTAQLLDLEGMPVQRAMVGKNLALIDELVRHDYDAAEERCEQAYRVLSEAGSNLHAALALLVLCEIAYARGDFEVARVKAEKSLERFRAMGNAQYVADANLLLAKIDFSRRSCLSSALLLGEAMLTYGSELGRELADCALLAGCLGAEDGDFHAAAELLAFFRLEQRKAAIPSLEPDIVHAKTLEEKARDKLSEAELAQAAARAEFLSKRDAAKRISAVVTESLSRTLV